jgi:hypothetical protein
MLSLHIVKTRCNRAIARAVAVALLTSALVILPMGLPGTSKTAEAGCFTFADNFSDLVSGITVCYNGQSGYEYSFTIYFTLASGATPTPASPPSCGNGAVEVLSTTNTDSASASVYTITVTTSDIYTNVTAGYRLTAYISSGTDPRKVHNNLSFYPYGVISTGCTAL